MCVYLSIFLTRNGAFLDEKRIVSRNLNRVRWQRDEGADPAVRPLPAAADRQDQKGRPAPRHPCSVLRSALHPESVACGKFAGLSQVANGVALQRTACRILLSDLFPQLRPPKPKRLPF